MTIDEVAKLAGVSKATVSRVVNNNGYVKDSTRKKVQKIIKEKGYVPSYSAVNLSKGVSSAIGVIVPEIDNKFYIEVMRGILDEVDKYNLTVLFLDTQNDAKKEEKVLRTIEHQRLKGIIIAPSVDYTRSADTMVLLDYMDRLNVPIVVVDRDFDNMRWDGVFYENYRSVYCATSELIKAGNKRIGIITGDMGLKIARDRYDGFMQAAHDLGVEVRKEDILIGDFSVPTAYRLSKELLSSGDYPDGIITCNNRTSIGFIKAANECGVVIGKDIAVVGIDRVPELDLLGIRLSCVSRDNYEMGRTALRLLIERIENRDAVRKICMIPYELELEGTEKKG